MVVETAKMGALMGQGAPGISRLLGMAKLQSAPGTDNPRYADAVKPSWLKKLW